MASTPGQEEFLAITRKSQEAVITAIKSWVETVKTTTPKLASVYAPFADRLPRLPSFGLPSFGVPFADRLPGPEEAVANAYHLAEQLLASQRRFTEDLLKLMTPLIPGRTESTAASPAAKTTATASVARDTALSAPASPAAKTAGAASPAARSSAAAKNTAAKSTAGGASAKKATAKSSPRSTAGRPAPKDTAAS